MTSPTGDVVVCDASPLIALARVDQLGLLQKIFRGVFVPPAVWAEATSDASAPGANIVFAATWIQVRTPLAAASSKRGLGEREAMGLAAELAAVLIVDDGPARAAATAMGLRITGTLGVLRRAKHDGHIVAVKPIISAMRANGLHILDAIVDAVLRDLGE